MEGTRTVYRVSWSIGENDHEEMEFSAKEEAFTFGESRVINGVAYLAIDEVLIDFDDEGDFGETALGLYSYEVPGRKR